jgi:hypothetical protein
MTVPSVRGGKIPADPVAADPQSLKLLESLESGLGDRLERARTPAELGDVLRSLCAPPLLPRLLDRILEKEDLTPLVEQSYRHPNHFEKLVLARVPSGHKVVAHVWPGAKRGKPHRDGNLHDHRWHFATYVLAGSYGFTEFEVGRADRGSGPVYREHRYSVGLRGEHRLEDVGPRYLVTTQRRTLRAGDAYLLPNSVIHHIEMDDPAPTVTLFVQGPPISASTRVFSRVPLPQAGQVNVPRMASETYREHLLGLRHRVAEGALRLV